MAAKGLTYEELIAYAREHYSTGGDGIYECWDRQTYDEYVAEFGPITKRDALSMFRNHREVMLDIMGM